MKSALLLVPLLATLAFAQEPGAKPPVVRIEAVRASTQAGEVRVDIEMSAPVDSPGAVVPYPDMLILDLPGVSFDRMGRRIQVNQADVKDVRVWMQQQTPPIVRISVGMNRDKAYTLSMEGTRLTLRIGPGVQTAGRSTKPKTAQQPVTVIPAGRASRSVAGTVGAIFTRDPKQPVPVSRPKAPANLPPDDKKSTPLPPIHITESTLSEMAGGPAAGAPGLPVPPGIPPERQEEAVTQVPVTPVSMAAAEPNAPTAIVAPQAPGPIPAVPATILAPSPASTAASIEPPPLPAALPAPETVASAVPALAVAAVPAAPPVTIEREIPEARAASPEPVPAVAVPAAAPAPMANVDLRTLFHIKFVQQETAYIDGGRTAGLTEGMKLLVSNPGPDGGLAKGDAAVAELVVVGIAETSAVTEIRTPKRDVVPGDLAYLSNTDLEAMVQQHSLGATRKYPVVISFTEEADALDAEARVEDVPRAPLPSVNRMQGRFGFDYIATQNLGSAQSSGKDVGVVIRADFTRMGGTYWTFRGYWRGRVDYLSSGTQPTLQELVNRTYHLALTYDNPTGHYVAGFGRLLLPWASSLETLDGGYFGRRLRRGLILGVFAGSTPDPSSWNYNPDRQIGGAFVNASGGSFEAVHYSSTTGAGTSLLNWKTDRPMLFFENSLSYRRNVSLYHSLQADSPAGNASTTAPGPGIGRSFLTLRWSPVARLELDFNHTYFRNVPTFDPLLIGTGLLDKYLFQGFSAGGRVAVVKQISVYTELGRSSRTGDTSPALNSLYGVTFGRVPWLGVRANVHYSRFNSSFGSGSYRALNLTRTFRESLRLELLGGTQAYTSTLAGNQTAKFLTATIDSNLGTSLFVQGGFTVYRGQQQNYNQWSFMMGYRFDSKWRRQ